VPTGGLFGVTVAVMTQAGLSMAVLSVKTRPLAMK
jgi:hypothetical protein